MKRIAVIILLIALTTACAPSESDIQAAIAETQAEEPKAEPAPTDVPITPEYYVEQYGGSVDVYRDIMTSEDCTWLKETFNRATDNFIAAEKGSKERQWSAGYMRISTRRIFEIGCYE